MAARRRRRLASPTGLHPVQFRSFWELLANEQVGDIHRASLAILEKTGLHLPLSSEWLGRLEDAGLAVDRSNKRVHFPPELVEAALEKAPRSYMLCARNPEYDLHLDGKHGYLCMDGSGTDVMDPETGEVKPSSYEDLARAVLVSDALPQISFLWPCVSAQDRPAKVQPLYELEAMLVNSSKHAQAMTAVTGPMAKGSVEMAAEVVGGREVLRKRPIISSFQCSTSPLSYDATSLEAAFVYAEAGIPCGFLNMTIGSGTAPGTVAGNVAQGNAEVIGGMTLLQLLFPGAPTFYGSCATVMELKSGGVTCGGPEDFMIQATTAQMARFYGVPSMAGTFATGAKASDWHSGVENTLSGATSCMAGAQMMCGAGLLNGARIFSFEQLIKDCEIYDMVRALVGGYGIDEETLAVDVIGSVGPGNTFLTEEHTLLHMRDQWQPTIIDRTPFDAWKEKGEPSAGKNAREMARSILQNHRPMELGCRDTLFEIIKAYEA